MQLRINHHSAVNWIRVQRRVQDSNGGGFLKDWNDPIDPPKKSNLWKTTQRLNIVEIIRKYKPRLLAVVADIIVRLPKPKSKRGGENEHIYDALCFLFFTFWSLLFDQLFTGFLDRRQQNIFHSYLVVWRFDFTFCLTLRPVTVTGGCTAEAQSILEHLHLQQERDQEAPNGKSKRTQFLNFYPW